MKRSKTAWLAISTLTAMTMSCFGATAAQASVTTTAPTAIVQTATSSSHSVSAIRQQVSDYVATAELDAATRASLEAALASDEAFEAASTLAVTQLQTLLTSAGVDITGALNPDDYVCGPTPMRDWVTAEKAQIDPDSWSWYTNGFFGMSPDLLVQYWTLMKTPSAPKDTAFGENGSKTNEMSRTFRALQKFWDIDGSNIGLVSYDAKVLADTDEARAERDFVYDGLAKVSALGSILMELGVESGILAGDLEGFPGGVDNPLFSVNSFAIDPAHSDSADMLNTLGITRRVAMGQGLIAMWDDLGLDRVGTRAVLAHEYGHQVQYDDDLFATTITDPAEATARTELMADAFASYFTVSKRGASLNKAQTLQDLQTFYNVGDCSFSSEGHHGTPDQRYRAAEWGAQLAQNAPNQGHILPSATVGAQFDAVLAEITAPDAQ